MQTAGKSFPLVHTSDTTNTDRLCRVHDSRLCHPTESHQQGCFYTYPCLAVSMLLAESYDSCHQPRSSVHQSLELALQDQEDEAQSPAGAIPPFGAIGARHAGRPRATTPTR